MQTRTVASSHRTSSLNAASFLLACDFPLVDAVRTADGRFEFLIGGDAAQIDEQLRQFRLGVAMVNALKLTEALRRLKGLIHGLD